MTRVEFHFNVPDRLGYACRLLRKAQRQGIAVAVGGPSATLAAFDRSLWTFEATEFVPHVRLRAGEALPPRLARTPVVLAERASDALPRPVLVHLGEEPPEGFESFERLIEIVSHDEAERAAARRRWRHYESRGYEIVKHEVKREAAP